MAKGIDCNSNCSPHVACLQDNGIGFVARYLSASKQEPLTRFEAKALSAHNIYIVSIREGGNPTSADYFTAAKGTNEAVAAIALALSVGQPKLNPIYFTVDEDIAPSIVDDYFDAIHAKMNGSGYLPGVYGSGAICQHLLNRKVVTHTWLAYPHGWSGYKAFHDSKLWNILQTSNDSSLCGLAVDYDLTQGNGGGWLLPKSP